MKEDYRKLNERYSKEINVKELISKFNSNPEILALPKDEREWLRNHCEFTMDTKDPKNAKRAVKLFNKEGYECVSLWNRDQIHPIERHFGLHLISVYAPVEEAYKISKIASKARLLLFTAYHYTHIQMHPLKSELYPVDVLDDYVPVFEFSNKISGVTLVGIRLFDTAAFLKNWSEFVEDSSIEVCMTLYLYDSLNDMLSGKAILKNAGIKTVQTFEEPKLEFGNIEGHLLLAKHSFDKIDELATLLASTNVSRNFIGIPLVDGLIPKSLFKENCAA